MRLIPYLTLIAALPLLAVAEGDLLTEDELEAAFAEAAAKFNTAPAPDIRAELTAPADQAAPTMAASTQMTAEESMQPVIRRKVAEHPIQVQDLRPYSAGITLIQDDPVRIDPASPSFAPEVDLAALRIAVNMEDITLQQAIQTIVDHAGDKVGTWDVKWRLQPENAYLLGEKMNVTAETTLGQFLEFMVDRVNNMTGVELFVSVFDVSRLIVISDTYY